MDEYKQIETKILAVSIKEGSMPGVMVSMNGQNTWINAIDMQAAEEAKKILKGETAKIEYKIGNTGKLFFSKIVKTKDAEAFAGKKFGQWTPKKPENPYNNITTNNCIIMQCAQLLLEVTKEKEIKWTAQSYSETLSDYVGKTLEALKNKQVFGNFDSGKNDANEENVI